MGAGAGSGPRAWGVVAPQRRLTSLCPMPSPRMWSCPPLQAPVHPLIAGPRGRAWPMRFLQWVDVPLHPVAQGRQLLVTGAGQVCLLLPEPLSGHLISEEPSWSQGRALASWSGSLRAGDRDVCILPVGRGRPVEQLGHRPGSPFQPCPGSRCERPFASLGLIFLNCVVRIFGKCYSKST